MIGDAIRAARGRLTAALRAWDPADAERCREACALLRETVNHLATVERNLENGATLSSVNVIDLTAIRSDVHRLGRLVEAAYAFRRRMANYVCREQSQDSGTALARG